jgi:hypothetical protein
LSLALVTSFIRATVLVGHTAVVSRPHPWWNVSTSALSFYKTTAFRCRNKTICRVKLLVYGSQGRILSNLQNTTCVVQAWAGRFMVIHTHRISAWFDSHQHTLQTMRQNCALVLTPCCLLQTLPIEVGQCCTAITITRQQFASRACEACGSGLRDTKAEVRAWDGRRSLFWHLLWGGQ